MSRYRKEIYPVSYFHSAVEDNQRLKEIIVPQIEESRDSLKNAPGGWLTTKCITSFENDELNAKIFHTGKDSQEIQDQYMNVLKRLFDDDWEADISDIWFNYYVDGEYQEAHTHFGNYNKPLHFACIHFLSFDPNRHSPLVFTDPITNLRATSVEMKSSGYEEKYFVNPKEGDFIMIPTYLEHEVKSGPRTPDYPRITVSFNLTVLKYGKESDTNGG